MCRRLLGAIVKVQQQQHLHFEKKNEKKLNQSERLNNRKMREIKHENAEKHLQIDK